jgi:hypothetical protein
VFILSSSTKFVKGQPTAHCRIGWSAIPLRASGSLAAFVPRKRPARVRSMACA